MSRKLDADTVTELTEVRRGRQTPTVSVVLPYTQSHGSEAVELYDRSGRTAQEWQALMMEDIMAVGADGLWVHMKFGWSIPRRNGKSEILIMRSIWALTHGERVLYTAHRTSTSSNAWEKVCSLLGKMGFKEDEDYKTYKTRGCERIEWMRGASEALINFRTRSAKGGLGEGYDVLIIDEAQEYTADQESALKYVVTSSPNPQTLMCGTPPTAVSAGDVFLKLRRNVLNGKEADAGWAEWSVPRLTDAHDPELWYETNPSLGTILSERTVRSELGDDQVDDNIQRLGLWLAYSQKSAISEKEWLTCKLEEKPELSSPVQVFYGVKYAQKTENVSLAAAVRMSDGRIFVEAIDCRSIRDGTAWIIAYLRSEHAASVAIDGAAGAPILVSDMADAGVKCKAVLPTVKEIIAANALFETNLFGDQIRHAAQPSLTQVASNCEHRSIGTSGGFGYTSILDGADVSLLEAIALAHWGCASVKPRKKQVMRL
jgi:phage terminase large subunit-like protein